MKKEFYTRLKMKTIILDLIYLHQEMKEDGNTDRQSLKELLQAINTLQYYLQFLEPITKKPIKYYKG